MSSIYIEVAAKSIKVYMTLAVYNLR